MPKTAEPNNPVAYTNLNGIKKQVIDAAAARGMNLGTFIRFATEEQARLDGFLPKGGRR